MSISLKSLFYILLITLIGSGVVWCLEYKIDLSKDDYKYLSNNISILNDKKNNVDIKYLNIYSSHSPVNILIKNELGQRLGFNSITKEKFTEIPNAYQGEEGYESADSTDFYNSVDSLLERPLAGFYFINVIGVDDTNYSLYVSLDTNVGMKKSQISSTIKKGETQEFVAELMGDGQVSIERK